MNAVVEEVVKPLKLDLGSGPNKKEGFTGVDTLSFDGKVDVVFNLAKRIAIKPAPDDNPLADREYEYQRWPWEDNSVDEVHASHFVEHLDAGQRMHFANELYRVMKKGAKATIVTPHYASERAYGDLTHAWPPVVGFWFAYLDADWRKVNAPHNTDYTCDFKGTTWGFSLHQSLVGKNPEYQQHALTFWREAAQDMIATLTK